MASNPSDDLSSASAPSSSAAATSEAAAHQTLLDKGIAIRTEVMGAPYVERVWANTSDFMRPMQALATEVAMGTIWSRPGLDRRTRSLITVAMLAALGRSQELGGHVKGAVRNGVSEAEIQEALLQASVYAGMPAGFEGFRAAERALEEMRREAV